VQHQYSGDVGISIIVVLHILQDTVSQLKLVDICRNYNEINMWTLFGTPCRNYSEMKKGRFIGPQCKTEIEHKWVLAQWGHLVEVLFVNTLKQFCNL